MESKKLTYQLPKSFKAPIHGEYLVMIGKKGVNQVCVILSVEPVKHKKETRHQSYKLTLQRQDNLKELTEYVVIFNGTKCWVRGEEAHPCYWLQRNKKKNF